MEVPFQQKSRGALKMVMQFVESIIVSMKVSRSWFQSCQLILLWFTGVCKFKSGESQILIKISLLNDPTGSIRHFVVHLNEVQGRDKAGDKNSCKVVVANLASKSTE